MTDSNLKGAVVYEKLQRLANDSGKQPLTMADAFNRLSAEDNDFGMPLLLLSLPGAIPGPALGLNTVLGVAVTLIGLQMFIGMRSVWLPRWFTHIPLRPSWMQRAIRIGGRLLLWVERLFKPRMNWMKCRLGISLLGLIVVLLGLLMMIPVPGTNSLPSVVLLLLSFGLIETDGLLTLLAAMTGLMVVFLYADIIYLVIIWLSK